MSDPINDIPSLLEEDEQPKSGEWVDTCNVVAGYEGEDVSAPVQDGFDEETPA